jgi:AraC family transcriptional regulator of adaptative response/methylated-DNA-[protein]-cysteine methyltransferase
MRRVGQVPPAWRDRVSESGVALSARARTVLRMDLDEQRWHAVSRRAQPHETGLAPFLYAVRTTGVFCRPGCPSRLPRRENIAFFDGPDAAVAAGFRACLRCRPHSDALSGTGVSPEAVTLERVLRACRAMIAHGGPLPAADLQALVGCSPRQLARDFATLLGASPQTFGHAVRTGEARSLLRAREQIAEAVFDAGYGSVRGFYEKAAPTLGMTPSAYSAGGAGQRLRWTSVETQVGTVLAVAGDLGLAAVRIGPDAASLLEEVRIELPAAIFVRADEELADTAVALRAVAEGHPAQLDLPVDVAGTAFQARVWAALRRIPAGQTLTYAEVAADIGAPTAVRAVASACAANRIALVVPCHRVIRSDGSLGGYRWGLSVKQQLLDAELARTSA